MPKVKNNRKAGRRSRNGPARGRARRPTGIVTRKVAPIANITRTAYSINSRSRDSVIISGRDLLGSLHAEAGKIGFCASPNPVTWPGTRISAAARGYANWKPLRLQLHFVTSTNTTRSGTGVLGTVFGEQVVDPDNFAALLTSNGGVQFQVWTDCTSNIDCSRLTQLRYYTSDQHGPESCPFRFYGLTQGLDSGTNADYGTIYVDYTYELSNPLVVESFPMMTPGGKAIPAKIKAGVAGTTMKIKVALQRGIEAVLTAGKAVGAYQDFLKSGDPYHLTQVVGAALAPPANASNEDCEYTVAEAFDGEEIKLPDTLAADVDIEAFFWFQGEKAAY